MEQEDATNVLRDVGNEDVGNSEDEDFALAKLMQEQERALFHARAMYGYGENDGGAPDYIPLRDDLEHGILQASESGSESSESAGVGEPASEDSAVLEGGDDDEALARRLHIQEQLDHQRRLLELAGIAPEGEGYSDEDDEGYLTDDSVDPDEMTYEELRALGDAVGVVSRGASLDIIKALPYGRYTGPGKRVAQPEGGAPLAETSAACQEEQCVVCRMEFEGGEDVKLLPCKHLFHPDCIDQWLMINKACPICASEVTATAEGVPLKGRPGFKSSKP